MGAKAPVGVVRVKAPPAAVGVVVTGVVVPSVPFIIPMVCVPLVDRVVPGKVTTGLEVAPRGVVTAVPGVLPTPMVPSPVVVVEVLPTPRAGVAATGTRITVLGPLGVTKTVDVPVVEPVVMPVVTPVVEPVVTPVAAPVVVVAPVVVPTVVEFEVAVAAVAPAGPMRRFVVKAAVHTWAVLSKGMELAFITRPDPGDMPAGFVAAVPALPPPSTRPPGKANCI